MYINTTTNQYPVTESEIRNLFYPTSLPIPLSQQFLTSIGYAQVLVETESNAPKKPWETLTPKAPEKIGNTWVQGWSVTPLTLQEKKARMLSHFNEIFNSLISQVKVSYPSTEVESWYKQEKEAREYIADETAQASLVRSIAQSRGVSVEWLANKIVEKSDAYASYVGNLIGTRQLLEYQIMNATEENIDSITWPPED